MRLKKFDRPLRFNVAKGIAGKLSPTVSQAFRGATNAVATTRTRLAAKWRFKVWRWKNSSRKILFVTFADGHHFTSDRIVAEVSELGTFDVLMAYGPTDLDTEFVDRYSEHLKHARGFGFWAWKPQVLLQALRVAREGDIVVYADAGCSVLPLASERLQSLLIDVTASKDAILVTQNPTPFLTKHWTKSDLLAVFGLYRDEEALHSRQIEAGRLAVVKSEKTMALINKWLEIASELHLIDDSPSQLPNDPTFIEHRHDQSIFSLLIRDSQILTGLESVFDTSRLRATR
jgi:hypothetical protein